MPRHFDSATAMDSATATRAQAWIQVLLGSLLFLSGCTGASESTSASYPEGFPEACSTVGIPAALEGGESGVPMSPDAVVPDTVQRVNTTTGPSVKGGWQTLVENIDYPELALREEIGGEMYVGFIVGTDGRAYNVRILRGMEKRGAAVDQIHAATVQGVRRTRFQPGKKDGQPICVPTSTRITLRVRKGLD
jgi:TonB family protein